MSACVSAQGARHSAAFEAARTINACTACRERKVKCSGTHPCRFCSRRRLECIFRESGKRKLYSVEYVKSLERKLNIASAATQAPNVSLQSTGHPSPSQGEHYVVEEPSFSASPVVHDNGDENETHSQAEDVNSSRQQGCDLNTGSEPKRNGDSAIFTDPLLSSSVIFGSQIKAITIHSDSATRSGNEQFPTSPDNAYGLKFRTLGTSKASNNIKWPTESEAEELLTTVMSSVGKLQHLFDPRAFSDRLSQDYRLITAGSYPEDVWYVEMLLVLAVGALLKGHKEDNDSFPGAQFFTEAMMRSPDLIQLRAAGTLGVEINGLSAFFLQCADRKDDAYVYAGTALRLAISMGLFRENRGVNIARSEIVHRNRLAWSIYMQERRLAAATGNLSLISDDIISIRRPTASPGFCSPTILNVNINIASITGHIIKTVYSQNNQSEDNFVSGVRDILSSLGHARHSMPQDCVIDSSHQSPITRNCITLNLMLYQAVILTTRPVLLHLAKARITNQILSAKTDIFQKFAKTCVDAAERSLTILRAAKEQHLIAPFGFFDLDALFSVAFVFVLAERVPSDIGTRRGAHDLKTAMEIFDYLGERGNKASLQRKMEIEQMCNHIGVSVQENNVFSDPLRTRSPSRQQAATPPQPGINQTLHANVRDLEQALDNTSGYLHPSLQISEPPPRWENDINLDDTFSGSDPRDVYTIYQSNDLMLSGSVELDWEELERQLLIHQ